MKPAAMVAVLMCLAVPLCASAQEQKLNPAKMTCADYTVVDEAYRPALVYYVAGVDKLGVKATDAMVIDTAHPVAETVFEECKKDPDASFMSKVRHLIKEKKIELFKHL